MGGPNRSDTRPSRPLTFVAVGMVVGFVFLLVACALMGWSYLFAPVPRSLAIAAVALGALSATVILTAVLVHALTGSLRR